MLKDPPTPVDGIAAPVATPRRARRTWLPLPHAYPFILVDRVVEIHPGAGAVALKNLTWGDPWIAPDGRLSPTLLAEVIAQCAGLAVSGARPGALAVLARIDRFRARPSAEAGDQLHVRVRVLRIFGGSAKVRGVIRINGRVHAAGDFVLSFVPGRVQGTEASRRR